MEQKQNDSSRPQGQSQGASTDKPQGKDAPQGLPGSALSGASLDKTSSDSGVGRQSGQQREHGHMNAADQARDGAGAAHAKRDDRSGTASDGTDRVGGHPETDAESVSRGRNGGLGED